MKYTEEELELLDTIQDETLTSVPFDNEALKIMASDTLEYLNEEK